MISLEQIRELNDKVQSTLEVIKSLREENTLLRSNLAKSESRVKKLDLLVSSFRNDQHEIEEGLKSILLQLNRLEDDFTASSPASRAKKTKAVGNAPVPKKGDGISEGEKPRNSAADGVAESKPPTGLKATPTEVAPNFSSNNETISSPVEESAKSGTLPSKGDDGPGEDTPKERTPGSDPSSDKVPIADGSSDKENTEPPPHTNNGGELELF